MAYTNQQVIRNQLHKELIDTDDKPCATPKCLTPKLNREIHRIIPGQEGGEYTRDNVKVLCRACHLKAHPISKFMIGDVVVLNGRTPQFLDTPTCRPRTIIAIRYDKIKQCNFYTLGSNGRGANTGQGNPLDGYTDYGFRSYQLVKYDPRAYNLHNDIISSDENLRRLRVAQGVIYSELTKTA